MRTIITFLPSSIKKLKQKLSSDWKYYRLLLQHVDAQRDRVSVSCVFVTMSWMLLKTVTAVAWWMIWRRPHPHHCSMEPWWRHRLTPDISLTSCRQLALCPPPPLPPPVACSSFSNNIQLLVTWTALTKLMTCDNAPTVIQNSSCVLHCHLDIFTFSDLSRLLS